MIARDLFRERERAFTFVSRAARASSGRDRRRRGLGGARSVTAEDSLGDLGRVLCRRDACRVLEGGRDAVPFYRSNAALDSALRSGVIAALGDDAAELVSIVSSDPQPPRVNGYDRRPRVEEPGCMLATAFARLRLNPLA